MPLQATREITAKQTMDCRSVPAATTRWTLDKTCSDKPAGSRATASPKVIQSFSTVLLGKTFKKLFQLDRKTVNFIYRITARGAKVIIFKRGWGLCLQETTFCIPSLGIVLHNSTAWSCQSANRNHLQHQRRYLDRPRNHWDKLQYLPVSNCISICLYRNFFIFMPGKDCFKGTSVFFHKTVRVCHIYCNYKIGSTCQITVIFGTLKDGSLLINTLASNIFFSYRNMFQNGVDALSKIVDAFLSKSSKFYLVWIIR